VRAQATVAEAQRGWDLASLVGEIFCWNGSGALAWDLLCCFLLGTFYFSVALS